jgi:hypothetical protein
VRRDLRTALAELEQTLPGNPPEPLRGAADPALERAAEALISAVQRGIPASRD